MSSKGNFLIEKSGFPNLLSFVFNTVLAEASGTHFVCVCTIHQNVKLMMFSMPLSDLLTYHHCLARIICNHCYLGECDVCPGVEKFKEEILKK